MHGLEFGALLAGRLRDYLPPHELSVRHDPDLAMWEYTIRVGHLRKRECISDIFLDQIQAEGIGLAALVAERIGRDFTAISTVSDPP